MHELTKITFHGSLGEKIGRKTWELNIASPSEGLRAVDTMSKRKLSRAIMENEKLNVKYKVLVDDNNLFTESVETKEEVMNSAMFINRKYKTIDIIPVLEGALDDEDKDMAMMVGGAVLFGLGAHFDSAFMMTIGMFSFLTGMANMLAQPPEHEDFKEIQQVNKKESYLWLYSRI